MGSNTTNVIFYRYNFNFFIAKLFDLCDHALVTRTKRLTARRKWKRKNPEKVRAAYVKWKVNNPDRAKEIDRAGRLKYKFNLTIPQWNTIFTFQKGLCAICQRPADHFKTKLAVDHDHSTRVIRGLLCYGCNSLLPNRKLLVDLLKKALEYLQSPPAVAALGAPHLANPIHRKKRKTK